MDGQWTSEVRAVNSTQSMHYTFPPVSAIAQVSLSGRWDYDDWAVPISRTVAAWTSYTTKDGSTSDLVTDGIWASFVANDLTEAEGLLIADNCNTGAIVNFFFWPSVY